MNRQDRVHRILFGAEHHLQFIGPNGGIEPFQLGPDLFLGLIILLLGGDFGKNPKIFEAAFLLLPFLDRIRQPAFFPEDPARLFRFIPETVAQGFLVQLPDTQFFFRDVKDRPRNVRFSGPDRSGCHEFLPAFFLLLCRIK